jgi:ACT domain-containing protein
VESTISLYLYDRRGQEELSKLLDRVSFALLAIVYIIINIAIPLAAIL